jgi:hypothetical protein
VAAAVGGGGNSPLGYSIWRFPQWASRNDIIALPEIILETDFRLHTVQIVKVMKKINQMNIRLIRLGKISLSFFRLTIYLNTFSSILYTQRKHQKPVVFLFLLSLLLLLLPFPSTLFHFIPSCEVFFLSSKAYHHHHHHFISFERRRV